MSLKLTFKLLVVVEENEGLELENQGRRPLASVPLSLFNLLNYVVRTSASESLRTSS